jgi:uncharacterized lipoprotein YddW (UPF0748 family)
VKNPDSSSSPKDSSLKIFYKVLFVFALLTSTSWTLAQAPPKREFRGAWIATVSNLDWPTHAGDLPSTQRAQLSSVLDGLQYRGINAVIFQVRPACDAFYPSLIEPWSYWLTGVQGADPVTPFDPLQFAIDEAHKRGIELHAWFNPYRAEVKVGQFPLAANHVVNQHPDWVLTFGTLRTLDPGIPEVRKYVVSVIMDVVRRYEIDGIHWDDYFYPYSGIANEDSASWRLFNRGFANKADWRRDNVNLLVKTVHDSLMAVKPDVKFGISPFGIWKNGIPSGITGMSSYDDIYCDPVTWLSQQWVDYITPQLYWPFGGSQDYARLMPWWSSVKNGRHFYPGQAPYRITDGNWGASEVPNQIRLNRTNSLAQGSVFFRATYGVTNNPKGFADSLKTNLYKYPALRPTMSWKETIPPNNPQTLTIAKFSSSAILSWKAPPIASDGGVAEQYVVYRSATLPINIDDARNIVSLQSSTSYAESSLPAAGATYYYGVTALDRLQNESGLSNVMGLTSSGVVGVEEQTAVISEFKLYQNFPNPFNPSTVIGFHVPNEQYVSLRIFDMLGREVRVVAEGMFSAGDHRFQFDGTGLSSGVYIYRIVAGKHVESRKMQLLK